MISSFFSKEGKYYASFIWLDAPEDVKKIPHFCLLITGWST